MTTFSDAYDDVVATEAAKPGRIIYTSPLHLNSEALDMLYKSITYIVPIMLFFGTIGNVLAFLILWRRKALNKNTTTVYLLTLAVIDQLLISTGLLQFWYMATFNVDLRNTSSASCTTFQCFLYSLFICES